ncbi:MAG: energy transducer TonB, partial [Gammaproteobacteria bacterium]|nr:energy transducer TonB [Gammaproteobacteria bacterium]
MSDLTWGPFATMDASQKVLTFAVGVSILIHGVILSIHFKLPDALRKLTTPQTLEVVLVNSKSTRRPLKPDVLAQSSVDGGGNTDADRRAKSTS